MVSSCGAGRCRTGRRATDDEPGRSALPGRHCAWRFCSQATTYLNRTTGGDEGGNAANIAALICGLVSDGIITGDLAATGCGV